MTPNNFRVKNGLTVANGVTIEAGNLTVSTGYLVVNGAIINSSSFTGTANNALYLGGKTEGTLNVNSAILANNATYAFGKTEGNLNVNSALIANNATYAFGKSENQLNANGASYLTGYTFQSPPAIGVTAANTGTFTDVVISGNLTVQGTTTSIDTTELNVGDNLITLNADLPSNTAPTQDAGIEINRGSATDVSLIWDEANDKWTVGLQTFVAQRLEIADGSGSTFINTTFYSGTANNASYLGGNTASDLLTYADNKASNAYANAVSVASTDATNKAGNAYSNAVAYTNTFASNASNITSGTLDTARLPATANISSAINVGANVNLTTANVSVGNTDHRTMITANTVTLTDTTTEAGNTFQTSLDHDQIKISKLYGGGTQDIAYISKEYITLTSGFVNATSFTRSFSANTTQIYIGNTSLNTKVTQSGFVGNGALITSVDAATLGGNSVSTILTYADNKASNAYANAVSVASTDATNKAGNAYSNAVLTASTDATNKAGNAYSNAVSTAATDATNKAGNAYSNAVSTAATDATNKAANAYSNAVAYTNTFASNATNISSGTLNSARLPTSGVVANTYGNSSQIPVFTVDVTGRVTNATTASVSGVTSFTYTQANSTFTIGTGGGSFYANINYANSVQAGLIRVIDSINSTDTDVAASLNSVKNAYDRAIDANTRAASAQTAAEFAYSNAYSFAATEANNKASNAYSNAVSDAINHSSNATNLISGTVAIARLPVIDSVSNTSANLVAVANSVKTAYDAALAANLAAANAYSNAITYASNATNISSGTLDEIRLPYRMNQNVRSTDSVTFANGNFTASVSIAGDLTVTGNVTSTNVSSLDVADPLIKLGVGNAGDTYWGGFTFHYSGSGNTTNHAGLVRDPSTKEFVLMSTYGDENNVANNNAINIADASFSYANLQVLLLKAGNSSVYSTLNATSFSGTANNATYAFGKSETALNVNSAVYSNGSISNAFTVGTSVYFVANGNVGVNTNTPNSTLHVNGTLKATELVGTTDAWWYVSPDLQSNMKQLHVTGSKDANGYLEIFEHKIYAYRNYAPYDEFELRANGHSYINVNGYNFGVGTTNPTSKLHVVGTASLGNTTITGFANVTSTIQGGAGLTIAGAASGITTLAAGNTTITGFANVSGNIYSNNLLLQGDGTNAYIRPTNSGSALYLGANNQNHVYVTAAGNLGVGGSPSFKLDSIGNANSGVIIRSYNSNTGSGATAGLQLQTSTVTGVQLATQSGYVTGTTTAHPVYIYANNTTAVTITDAGNIGIGNTAPTNKLSVNGTTFLGGAVSGITTLATGNTTITGFLVVNTTLRVDSSALFQGGSLFLGNYASANQTMTIAANTGFDAQLKLMEAADTYGFTIRNVNGGGLNILRHSANSTGTTALFINRDTGNIGVANSSPSHKLSVNGTTYLQGVTTHAANVAMDNNYLLAPTLKAYSEDKTTNATTTGAVTLDLSTTNVFDLTLTGNTTFTFSNPPASTKVFSFSIIAKQDATGGRTITWPASKKFAGGVAPPATTTANAIDVWSVMTYDGGTSYIISLSVKDAK